MIIYLMSSARKFWRYLSEYERFNEGFLKACENYEFVADWWAIETFTGQKQEDFLNKITRQYAYETVLDKVKDMGYSIVEETQDLQQNLRLTVRRWK